MSSAGCIHYDTDIEHMQGICFLFLKGPYVYQTPSQVYLISLYIHISYLQCYSCIYHEAYSSHGSVIHHSTHAHTKRHTHKNTAKSHSTYIHVNFNTSTCQSLLVFIFTDNSTTSTHTRLNYNTNGNYNNLQEPILKSAGVQLLN